MSIDVKIVADSINIADCRIVSFVATYPRFIHSEVMTHRVFSRNAASSRAIPISKMIERIKENPAMPIHWGKNQKGMKAAEELNTDDKALAKSIWLKAADNAIASAEEMTTLGVHKQIANRLLEPFAHMTTLITATEWSNFFNLRAHKDAQPEFQELAFQMLEAIRASTPALKQPGEAHLPFADQYMHENLTLEQKFKIVTARAARVSYLNFEGDIDHEKDYQLHDQLSGSGHWSPFEHAATALGSSARSGNFVGWCQYRKSFSMENREHFDLTTLLASRPLPSIN